MTAKKTVLQVFVEESGMRKAMLAVRFLAAWGALYEGLGRPPMQTEIGAILGRDLTTTWRYGSAFKAVNRGESAATIWKSLPKSVRAGDGRSDDERVADVASSPWVFGDGDG